MREISQALAQAVSGAYCGRVEKFTSYDSSFGSEMDSSRSSVEKTVPRRRWARNFVEAELTVVLGN